MDETKPPEIIMQAGRALPTPRKVPGIQVDSLPSRSRISRFGLEASAADHPSRSPRRHPMRPIHALTAFLFTGAAGAADLEVGSPAPPLNIEKWIAGEPVVLADGKDKNIYVVESWATWCGPCIRTTPHMTKLAKTFEKQGVKVIGVSIDGENTRSNVEPFVKKMGKKMDYTVALDRLPAEESDQEEEKKDETPSKEAGGKDPATAKKEPTTSQRYLEAAQVGGIPHAFIVGKDGKIAWHGHPMDGLDRKIAEMVGDKDYAERAKKIEDLREKIGSAFEAEKLDEALGGIEELQKLEPNDSLYRLRYHVLLVRKKDAPAAALVGAQVLKSVDDPEVLNEFSWGILTDEEMDGVRDTRLALDVAKKANDLTGGKDWSIVDTYARALFDTGDKKSAISEQKKAITLAEEAKIDSESMTNLKDSLDRYEGKTGDKESGEKKEQTKEEKESGKKE
jgi:thiol-disulfide isomerase/thioredoxin